MIEGLSTNTYMGRREGETLIKDNYFSSIFPYTAKSTQCNTLEIKSGHCFAQNI